MKDGGLEDTVNSQRRITTTGAVAAAVLLVGAVVLLALSVLFSLSRFTPYGIWSVLAVLGIAALAAALVWLRGPGAFQPLARRRRRPTLGTDMVLRAPPPPPVRIARPTPATAGVTGRWGAEATVNRLIDERRYDEALDRLAEIEAADPAMRTFCTVKRRAIARRQARRR